MLWVPQCDLLLFVVPARRLGSRSCSDVQLHSRPPRTYVIQTWRALRSFNRSSIIGSIFKGRPSVCDEEWVIKQVRSDLPTELQEFLELKESVLVGEYDEEEDIILVMSYEDMIVDGGLPMFTMPMSECMQWFSTEPCAEEWRAWVSDVGARGLEGKMDEAVLILGPPDFAQLTAFSYLRDLL